MRNRFTLTLCRKARKGRCLRPSFTHTLQKSSASCRTWRASIVFTETRESAMGQQERDVLAGREIVSVDEWRRARIAHLQHEKEHTRQRDALVEERRRLPL